MNKIILGVLVGLVAVAFVTALNTFGGTHISTTLAFVLGAVIGGVKG